MIETLFFLLKVLVVILPFIIFALINTRSNLDRNERHRQCYMPFAALLFFVIIGFFMTKITDFVMYVIESLAGWIGDFGNWLAGLFGGALADVGTVFNKISEWLADFVENMDLGFWVGILVNTIIIIIYILYKNLMIRLLKAFAKEGKRLFDRVVALVYYKDDRKGEWYVKKHLSQGRTLAKSFYIASLVLAVVGISVTAFLYKYELISSLYYPVFSVILVSEIYFYLDGNFEDKEESTLEGEDERSSHYSNYTVMRNVLRRSFGDKLLSENTTFNNSLVNYITNDELITQLENDDDVAVEAYGRFMHRKIARGLEVDQNYLKSGLDLMKGKSILFNNPFYYDLIPYIFYPMNRTILRNRKVLIVLGRHSIENGVADWCRQGLASVNHIPTLWNVGVLGSEEQNLDVGIITRSNVHDLKLHEANEEFFKDVEFVVLIEPSKLVATAQIGLNSLVRHCRRDGKRLVFCSTDKNCDGIVDSLSHILMTSLEEVSATNKHSGVSSYMCWEVDDEHLQHRLLPNLSRYLGVGTELSVAALKNQVAKTSWYGGDAFPVLDMHWIAKQYHYDLLTYASLPAQQSVLDDVFKASPNMWEASVEDNNYITVEDESYNMFEVKREFSTRARRQGFINVISSDYLLKDYMSENDTIFDSDSKAIPYIVADYADTERNIIYRLCLRLSSYMVPENEIARELSLLQMDISDVKSSIWRSICKWSNSVLDNDNENVNEICVNHRGREYRFGPSVIGCKRQYSFKTGQMETMYYIDDPVFVNVFIGDLCSAEYISEDETGDRQYLGTELRGHVFQKYLPGQFFTFGGKYYEMVRLSSEGKVVVRRAADHINGRPQYRQVRNYAINAAVDSQMMGDNRDIGGITVKKQYADISVETPAYWNMKRYNDFTTGKLIAINGVPKREYLNKAILKIDFGENASVSKDIVDTLALLMNEVFRTLYADNQGMIVAVTSGEAQIPSTYSLKGENGCEISDNSIYIIEDSQLDIGLLVSVERNLNRIFTIIYDYLGWHFETYENSVNPPVPVKPSAPTSADSKEADEEEKPKRKGIMKIFGPIGDFFKKIFNKIFKRGSKEEREKKKKEKAEAKAKRKAEKEEAKAKRKAEKEAKKAQAIQEKEERKARKALEKEAAAAGKEIPADENASQIDDEISEEDELTEDELTDDELTDEELTEEDEYSEDDLLDEEYVEEDETTDESTEEFTEESTEGATQVSNGATETVEETASTETVEESASTEAATEVTNEESATSTVTEETNDASAAQSFKEDDDDIDLSNADMVFFNIEPNYNSVLNGETDDEIADDEITDDEITDDEITDDEITDDEITDEPSEEPVNTEPESSEVAPEATAEPAAEITVEADEAKPADGLMRQRKPYHERFYMLYGGTEIPENLNITGVFDFLQTLGYGNGFLEQARKGKEEAQKIESAFDPNRPGVRYCDFCGTELVGTEYDILADGRERCIACARTAVKTEADFISIYENVINNLKTFYGIVINVPVKIKMVNAKKLHRSLGKSFVPTGAADGRILGVAIKSDDGYTILLENGAPRLKATMTMVHELTHIWQYLNWDAKAIKKMYGKDLNLMVYEGMAKWSEIQYAYLINEPTVAKREEIITLHRDDEYGHGFIAYLEKYPLSEGTMLKGETPFDNPSQPL